MIQSRLPWVAGLAVLAVLALPGSALAAQITVTSPADPGVNDSLCTLREAIQAANSGVSANGCTITGTGATTIGFDSSFNGQAGDAINLGAALPSISSQTDIDGCSSAVVISGPCVDIVGQSANSALVVDGVDNTSVSGVAVTGAKTGIELKNGVSGFSATNDWFGVTLGGTPGANGTGIFVGPGSDSAQIGDGTAGGRNVFAGNSVVGLDIEGADDNTVRGNYFGVAPNGTTAAASPVDIEITGTQTGSQDATGNVVGGRLSASEASTAACDGPCNVISSATNAGIDLNGDLNGQGETPAGQTTISGNHIGFGANGVVEHANDLGVKIGGADNVTVGGTSSLDANHVVVHATGIESSDASHNQLAQNNVVGLNYQGTALQSSPVPAGGHGILLAAYGGDATVLDNRVSGPASMDDPIETLGGPALISRNLIGIGAGGQSLTGGDTGIDVVVGAPISGTTVTGNFVQNSDRYGIELQGAEHAVVTGNTVLGSGIAGVWVHNANNDIVASIGDRIGGDTAAEENVISGSAGAAVQVDRSDDHKIFIARNTGSGNGGTFIDLGADGAGNLPGGPNGGIQAPVISEVTRQGASGTATPGSTVRAFSKSSSAPGEIAGFLGMATTDSSGDWQIEFGSPVAGGAAVGVTQTTDSQGTSEFAFADAPADPPPPPDRDPPETVITDGPAKTSQAHWAKFRFGSDEAGSSFLCRLDGGTFRPCGSPRLYRHLKPGRHVFRVKAIDQSGNTDPTAAQSRFRVLP